MSKPEVLAPVGNWEMLEAAVRAGADSVYLGMQEFNARRGAKNFDRALFQKAVDYCHVRGVRVYLTLNTLIADGEMKRACETASYAYECGVDAVIVQDLGLACILRDQLPDLQLHASTQLSIHSPAAIPVLKQLGFSQVVVAREMSREELASFCRTAAKYDIRVEAFVHGALCMSVSGQCYLSAMLGGRSGNRGLCAGPCRLPFSFSGEGYDLSLKDLSLVDHLNELADIGVSCFKIEGRMKRPEYVAAAAAVCRKILDGEDASEWKRALNGIFSRSGFTDGYYTAKRGRGMFGVRQKEDVLLSASVIKKLHELYRTERQRVAIKGTFQMCGGKPLRLTLEDGINTVSVESEMPQIAKGEGLTEANIRRQLQKTGNTPYYFESLSVFLDSDLYTSAASLNQLRRNALTELSVKRVQRKRLPPETIRIEAGEKRNPKTPRALCRFSSVSQIPSDLCGIDCVVLPLEEAWETYRDKLPVCVDVPRGIVSEERVKRRLIEAKEQGVQAAFCGNLSAVRLAQHAGVKPIFDFSMNLFSSAAFSAAKELGACACVASFELTQRQINELASPIPVGMIVYGHLPLMLMRNCPAKQERSCDLCSRNALLTDRKGIRFPVRCREGYSELFNANPLWLSDKREDFSVGFQILYFTVETREACARVIDSYRKKSPPSAEFTRGLYYRGVE